MPDLGVYHVPQLKIQSCFRQCLGKDAFSYYGSVNSSTNIHLSTEVYVNSFCSYFCMPAMAVMLGDFWNRNILHTYSHSQYEQRMEMLKLLFSNLYPLLNSNDFKFARGCPHDQHYGFGEVQRERQALLKRELNNAWMVVQARQGAKKLVQSKFMDPVANISASATETSHSAFNIEELMDDDFQIS